MNLYNLELIKAQPDKDENPVILKFGPCTLTELAWLDKKLNDAIDRQRFYTQAVEM